MLIFMERYTSSLLLFDMLKRFQHRTIYVRDIILGKKNPGMNYLLHIESNESKNNMVPEKTQNSKTIYRYIASKTHNSTKTLRNDYNRLLQHRGSYLQPIGSLTCPYRIQESNRGLRDAISTISPSLLSYLLYKKQGHSEQVMQQTLGLMLS